MDRFFVKFSCFLWILFLVWLPVSSQAVGGLILSGQLGVDYEFYDHDSKADRLIKTSWLSKSISNHFLNMNLSGPIVNEDFATFVTRTKVYGAYYRASYIDSTINAQIDSTKSEYIDPNLYGFFGSVTLFPSRRYPLQMFYSQNEEYLLKPETKNQKTDGPRRSVLGVVSRYDSKLNMYGGNLRVEATDRLTIDADMSSRKSSTLRNYTFAEHNDLEIEFYPGFPIVPPNNPLGFDKDTTWNITIELINSDTTTGLTVDLDLDPDFFQFPANPADRYKSVYVPILSDSSTGSTILNIALDYQVGQYDSDPDSDTRNNYIEFIEDFITAFHEVTFTPDSVKNTNRFLTTIPGNMRWIIAPIDPASPPDMDSEGNEFAASVTYDTKEGIKNTTKLSASDRVDNFQNLTGDELSLSNDLILDINPRTSLSMRTNNLTGNTILGSGREQETSSFSNLTDISYAVFGGLNTSLTHAINSMSSVDPSSDASNLMNSLRGTVGGPTGYKDHDIEGSAMVTLTSTEQATPFDTTYDDGTTTLDTLRTTESSSSTYAFQLANSLSFYKFGMALTPDHVFKYQIINQSGAPGKQKLESTTNIKSIILDHKYLGDANIGLQHSYMRNMDDAGFNATNKISTNVSLTRDLSEDFSLKAGFGYVIQSYSIESQSDDSLGIVIKTIKPSETQSSVNLGSKMNILDRAFITTGYRISSQATSSTGILGISIRIMLPFGATLISDIKSEARELENEDPQSKFFCDNALSFNIRRIVLYFEYNYFKEERDGDTFINQLWTGKITRSF